MKFSVEVIAFTIDSCALAEKAGAQRIELCDNPGEGGTTPSYGMITEARKRTTLPLYPIIRPRGGDFLYSEYEFDSMKADIRTCKQMGCDGVVIGLLNADGTIDKVRSAALVSLAYPMGVTFHRAFDRTLDPSQALEDIINIGCERILTSGQHPLVEQGLSLITSLVQQADDRIMIMPGSGVRSNNIAHIATTTGAVEFHSSARKKCDSTMTFSPASMAEVLSCSQLDTEEVKAMINALAAL